METERSHSSECRSVPLVDGEACQVLVPSLVVVADVHQLVTSQAMAVNTFPIEILRHGVRPIGQPVSGILVVDQLIVPDSDFDVIARNSTHTLRPRFERGECHIVREESLVSARDCHSFVSTADRGKLDGRFPAILPLEAHRSERTGLLETADVLDRIPVLCPAVVGFGCERVVLEGGVDALDLGRLVEHPSRLELDILAVVVGQKVFPDASFPRLAPAEEFPAEFLVRPGIMDISEIIIMPVGSEITVISSYDVVGLGSLESVL